MPTFDYTASDRSGAIAKGTLEARNQADASRQLGKMGLFVLEVKPSSGGSKRPSLGAGSTNGKAPNRSAPTPSEKLSVPKVDKKPSKTPSALARATQALQSVEPSISETVHPPGTEPRKNRLSLLRASWTPLQRALYLRQLFAMFEAGIPLFKATELLTESPDYSPVLRARLMEIPRDLERGRMLSKSMERSKLFSRLVVSSVKVGEQSGRLDQILAALADTEENLVKLKRTLVSKLTYPAIVMVIMTLGLVVLGHVMSRVMASLPGFDPNAIPLLSFVTSTFRHGAFLPVCFLVAVGFGVLCWKTYVTPSWRVVFETYLLRLPVLGKLLARIESNTVTTQLSVLISAGITLDRALELSSDLVLTEVFRRALLQSKAEIRNGVSITESFQMSSLFPDDVLAMVSAGEYAGAMEDSMAKAADYCADQVERTLETALSLLEPLLIGFLGISIGTVILCTFVPVFNQIQTM